jgi:3-hydroxyacyl-[acyl-carrier-protein] dehydratase
MCPSRTSSFVFVEERGVYLSRQGIVDANLLAHRDEAIDLIDGVIDFNPDAPSMTAVKQLLVSDPVFNGHFPGNPVCRGTDMIEMCQLSAALFYFCLHGEITGLPLPRGIDRVVYRSKALPNDVLFIKMVKPQMERMFFSCSAVVKNQRGEKVITIEKIRGLMT